MMSVAVICPKCNMAITVNDPRVAFCAKCGVAFPEDLHLSIETALAAQKPPRPVLLTVGMVGSALFAAIVCLFMVLAPFNIGTYSINNEQVSGPEFLHRVGVAFGLLGVILILVSYALWRERSWPRPLMLLFWIVVHAMTIGTVAKGASAEIGVVVFFAIVQLAIAVWYLYGKSSVKAYYHALNQQKVSKNDLTAGA